MAENKGNVIVRFENVSFGYGEDNPILDEASFSLREDAKFTVMGQNGAGKSTLFKLITGELKPAEGKIHLKQGATIATGQQVMKREHLTETVREYFAHAFPENTYDLDRRIKDVLETVNLSAPLEKKVGDFSGGQQARLLLAYALIQEPDILLLDEPTNHLDAESVQWLEQHLQQYNGTVIAVTHDRYFLDNVAGWILELDRGHGIPFQGNYSSWLEQKQERLAQEEKAESKRKKTLEHELEWIRMSPKARQSKGRARLNRYEELVNQKQEQRTDDLEIYIPPGPRLGDVVVQANGVTKGFGDKLLYESISFDLPKGGIVGVIGPNGAGKTTLFKMIIGKDKPDSGSIKIGETVKLGYVDQDRSLDGNKTVYEVISEGQETVKLGKVEVNARGYCARFNFAGADQQKKVKDLSGGERNRVHLARMLKEGANLIILDEPTNDLDVNTLRALEEGLENFAGCAVISSHDRWFLDRIATHILAFEGDSKVVWFEGNYSDYEADRKKRLGKEADQPHRIRYRKLTRQ